MARRGKLKVFLGYADGVGKSTAMLRAAQPLASPDRPALATFPLDRSQEEHRSATAWLTLVGEADESCDLDVDAIVRRRSPLVLIRDLAHANAPATRHARRYQDVEELLGLGIDVYATLNVYNLQSLGDVVEKITGVAIKGTIPDRVLDEADEIELVDVSPETVVRRFQDGQIRLSPYVAEQAAQLYRPGNLLALRELAMRRSARWVDSRMRSYMRSHAIAGPWAAAERLLACVGTDASAEAVVRTTRRLADQLNAEWFALHVQTASEARMPEEEKVRLADILHLAEELGGRVATLPGTSVADAASLYAHAHNITRIVVGRTPQPAWRSLLKASIARQMIEAADPIDVHVVLGAAASGPRAGIRLPSLGSWHRYALAAVLVASSTLVVALLRQFVAHANLVMVYLLSVVLAAVHLGRGPAIAASVLSMLAFDLLLVPPPLTLAVADAQYLLTLAGLMGTGLLISGLAGQVRAQVDDARRREVETAALYALSRDLSSAEGLDSIIDAVVRSVGQSFDCRVAVMLASPSVGADSDEVAQGASSGREVLEPHVANWALRQQRPAGRGTDAFPEAEGYYIPLKTARSMVGVLGVVRSGDGHQLTPEQRLLLEGLANQAALAIERAQLAEAAQRAQLLAAADRLQSALLNSISHDLRTPLVSITGVLSSLEDEQAPLAPATRQALIETAREEAERLNRLVGNLLDMTRIEAGAVHIAWELEDIQDAIGSALEWLASRVEGREILVDLPADLPFVPMDFSLIVQVLVNVIDNALKYSPADQPIEISARASEEQVMIKVSDHGMGIPPEDLTRVFDKFYRVVRPDSVTGTGLGLSIAKGLVQAHGGQIWAENRPGGGAVLSISLPLEHERG